MKFKNSLLLLLLLFVVQSNVFSQNIDDLRQDIHLILQNKQATVGVAVMGMDGQDTITMNAEQAFPMLSVFKFPIALTVLNHIDRGLLSLEQEIQLKKRDLIPNTYSPIRDNFPEGITLSVSALLYYSVSLSDNIATDILLDLVGGVSTVENYIQSVGIEQIAIKYNEVEQHQNWQYQYANWLSPMASNQLLKIFFENEEALLSMGSHQFIWEIMKATTTGPNSIRGLLPKEAIIAHKTGHSGKNEKGLTAALNDMGIVFLPNGKYFYLTVFVSNSKEDDVLNHQIIAEVSKLTWDYFSQKYQ